MRRRLFEKSRDVEAKEEGELFTAGWDEGEALVLAPFSLAIADVEVDVDRSGQPLVPVGRNLDQEAVLQQRQGIFQPIASQKQLSLFSYFHSGLQSRWDYPLKSNLITL